MRSWCNLTQLNHDQTSHQHICQDFHENKVLLSIITQRIKITRVGKIKTLFTTPYFCKMSFFPATLLKWMFAKTSSSSVIIYSSRCQTKPKWLPLWRSTKRETVLTKCTQLEHTMIMICQGHAYCHARGDGEKTGGSRWNNKSSLINKTSSSTHPKAGL